MDFFDFIRELRTATPDLKKAEKAMKILGYICVFAAVLDFAFVYLFPFDELPFKLPPSYPYIALSTLTALGVSFFNSSRGIREMRPWGKRLGQFSVLALVLVFIGLIVSIFHFMHIEEFLGQATGFSLIFIVFFVIAMGQFVLPAYLGILYLGKLPVRRNGMMGVQRSFEEMQGSEIENFTSRMNETTYHDSPFPFGLPITFILVLGGTFIAVFITLKIVGLEVIGAVMIPIFLFFFIGPTVYNHIQSPFQKDRRVISSHTGGGSINLFNGTWPFFRLLLYEDGLEVRIMFHRYFIPYNMMDDPPEKAGFLSRGLLIKSDLPGVPSTIRLHMSGMKKLLRVLNETRGRYIDKISSEK
jgi:hypothetical protein